MEDNIELMCRNCGAKLDFNDAHDGVIECERCHNVWTVPKKSTSPKTLEYLNQGEAYLNSRRWDEAVAMFKRAWEESKNEPEVFWDLALANYKVYYIKDAVNNRLKPICCEKSARRFSDSQNYQIALRLATPSQREEYQRRANEIDLYKSGMGASGDGTADRTGTEAKITIVTNGETVGLSMSTPDFDIENGVLKKYKGKGGHVVIPYGVTRIGDRAFENCKALINIIIPESVTSIGKFAFDNCMGLTKITIPQNVTSIEAEAFRFCSRLTEVKNLSALKIVNRSDIDGDAVIFALRIYSSGESYLFTDKDGFVVYDEGFEPRLVNYIGTKTDIILPQEIRIIGKGAFEECDWVTSVEIPYGVTSIEWDAFFNCRNLKSVIIPDTVLEISGYAFAYCISLKSITIPVGVESLGEDMLAGCDSLESVTMPSYLAGSLEYIFSRDIPDTCIFRFTH